MKNKETTFGRSIRRLLALDIYIYTVYHFENALLNNIWNDLGCHHWRSRGWPNTCSHASTHARQEGVSWIGHRNLVSTRTNICSSVDWAALDWSKMGIDWTSAWAEGQKTKTSAAVVAAPTPTTTAAAAPVATTTAAKAAATTASSSGGTFAQLDATTNSLFSSLTGLANDLTSFGTATSGSGSVVSKIGNIGNKQGSNMIKVSSASGHQYSANFINTSGHTMTIAIWNKAYSRTGDAADAEANLGSCVAPTTPALSLHLAPGANQVVAFQEDSQIGFAEATTSIAASGAYATTWGEVNFVSTGCGYDMSAIMNPK